MIAALLHFDSVLNDTADMLGADDDTRIELGALLEIILAVSGIAPAVVFYPMLKWQNEAVALGYVVTLRLDIGGPVSVAGVVTVLFGTWD